MMDIFEMGESLNKLNVKIDESNNIQGKQLELLSNIHEELRIIKVRLSEINK